MPGKPMYDYDALKSGLKQIEANIAAIEEGLSKERQKKVEYEFHIREAEQILRVHKREDIIEGDSKK